MHDPDALYTPICSHDPHERARRLAEHREMHRKWQERMAPLQARDRRERRIGQTVLAAVAVAALGAFGYGVYLVMTGDALEMTVATVTKIGIGHIATTITVLRMVYAWHRRSNASALGRTADAAVSILPGR